MRRVTLACRSRLATIGMRGADDRAQALQQFAFGIVHVFGHGRAVQVQIDRVEAAAPCVADDVLGDALEGLARDMRRRAGAPPRPTAAASSRVPLRCG